MLTVHPEKWSVVLAGHFNRMIFTPMWVSGGRLTDAKGLEICIAFENPGDPIYVFDNLELKVQSRRLEITPRRFDPELLQQAASVATKILNQLPHTPMQATGVNFNFRAAQPEGLLLDSFNLKDNNQIADAQYQLQGTTVSRKFERGGKILNLNLSLTDDGAVGVNMNFHRDTRTADEAQTFLSTPIVGLFEEAQAFLKTVYNLQIEPNN